MLKWYRTHQEQIENIAQSLKELYYAPRPGPRPGVLPAPEQQGGVSHPGGHSATRRNARKTHPVTSSIRESRKGGSHSPGSSLLTVPAMRCCRCNTCFPRADYLYTKKSGLCISCWEAKVV